MWGLLNIFSYYKKHRVWEFTFVPSLYSYPGWPWPQFGSKGAEKSKPTMLYIDWPSQRTPLAGNTFFFPPGMHSGWKKGTRRRRSKGFPFIILCTSFARTTTGQGGNNGFPRVLLSTGQWKGRYSTSRGKQNGPSLGVLRGAYPPLLFPAEARLQVHLLPVNVNELWQVDRSALFPLWLLLLWHCRKAVPVSGLGKDIPQGNCLNITCQEE